MIQSSSEFFMTLPRKCCAKCGETIDEMFDCYTTSCAKCNHFKHVSIDD